MMDGSPSATARTGPISAGPSRGRTRRLPRWLRGTRGRRSWVAGEKAGCAARQVPFRLVVCESSAEQVTRGCVDGGGLEAQVDDARVDLSRPMGGCVCR